MANDLPETGLRAVVDNLDQFLRGTQAIENAYKELEAEERAVQAASEATAAAMERTAGVTSAAASEVQQAAQSWGEVASQDVVARIEAVYEAFGKGIGPEAEAALRELGAAFIETEEDAAQFAEIYEEELKSVEFSFASVAAKHKEFLQGIADTSAFQRLERAYKILGQQSPELVADLREQQKEWLDSGKSVQEYADTVEEAFGETIEQIDRITPAAEEATSAMDNLLKVFTLGVVNQIAGEMGQLGGKLVGLAQDSVQTAARLEELDLVLGNLAEQNDVSASALREQVEAIRAQGIQADVAYNLVSQFVQANLDLSKASELARLAQDAAVISMEDSSQALAGLLHGILTLQPEVLRYRGIIVDLQGEYQKWSDATGRSVLEMTSAEKQQIALDAALAQGATIAGTYESAMESASKQLRSFPRYIADLKAEFGEELLPVYSDVIFATKDLIKQVEGLPEPMKATIAASGALAGGLLKGTSSVIGFGAQMAQLVIGLKAAELGAVATSVAFGTLGIALAAITAVSVATYINAQEEAHRAEAAAILDSAETYKDYVEEAKNAELGSYALTEGLYEIAKGADAAKQGLDALALTEAFRDLDMVVGGARTGIEALDDALAKLEATGGVAPELLRENMERLLPTLDEAALAVLQDEEAVRRLGGSTGYSGDQLDLYVSILMDATREFVSAKEAAKAVEYSMATLAGTFREGEEQVQRTTGTMLDLTSALFDGVDVTEDLALAMRGMAAEAFLADPAVAAVTEQLAKLIEKGGEAEALQHTFAQLAEIAHETEAEITAAEQEAQADREKAEADHRAKVEALDADHAKRRADILGDIGDAHGDLLRDMARAEADYQADVLAVAEETARAVADAEAEYNADREKAHQDLLDAMADAERKYAQAVEDAYTDLTRDLAEMDRRLAQDREDAAREYADAVKEIERELAQDVEDARARLNDDLAEMEREHLEYVEALREEYGERRLAIEESYAKQAADIEKKYTAEAEGPDIDAQRQALQEELALLQDASKRRGVVDQGRIEQIQAALEELKREELRQLEERKQAELDELRAAYDEQQAVEQQAYDDAREARQSEYDKRVEELTAQAEREKEERQRAYDEELADLEREDQRKRDERERAYQEQLDDLKTALKREKDERQRAYDAQLADLEAAHVAELASIDAANAEKLDRLDAQNAAEKERLQAATDERVRQLGQQLADEQTAYDDRLTQLGTALDNEKATIDAKMGEQIAAVATAAGEQTRNYVKAWEDIDPTVAAALQKLIDDALVPKMDEAARISYDKGRQAGEAYARGFQDGSGLHSIPPWVTYFGREVQRGLDETLGSGNLEKWAAQAGEGVTDGFRKGMDIEPILQQQVDSFGEFKLQTEAELGVSSPSKWAQQVGLSVAEGFGATAVLEPTMGGQDMAIRPYLADMPQVQPQEMAVQPYLLDTPSLGRVDAAIPAGMAAAGAAQAQSVTNTREFNLNYTGAPQDEPSLRALIAMMEMRAGHG